MNEGRGISQLFRTRKTKTTKTTLCAHQQDYHLVWFLGIMPCRCPGTYIHTYIHTYITHISSNRCFQSHAPMVFFCVFQNKYSFGLSAAEMQGGESEALLIARYVCMYSFEYSQPAGKYANSYNSCMIQYQTLKPQ